ncbi:MAG: ATP-binding cassette domain-containing protein [Caldilinea sp.]|nr:ATP-binding cassette domain-containing protein [Caldilinea sp.]
MPALRYSGEETGGGAAASPPVLPALIELQEIVKVYPPALLALDHISLRFVEGEIHALVGENGAGKSTLMKVLYGLAHPDRGRVLYQGREIRFASPAAAIAAGIGMVHQEIVLVNEYTVWENIVLGAEPVGWFGQIDRPRARRQVQAIIDRFQFELEPDARVADISVAARQKVEILKLLYREVRVLILDEPTAVLAPQEIPQLFAELRALRDQGHTISLQVHAGELVGVAGVEGNGQLELVHAIVGLLRPNAGRIVVAGTELTAAPILARRRVLAFVAQDRGRMGGSLSASVVENAIMTHHRLNRRLLRWRGWLLDVRAARRFTAELVARFAVSTPALTAPLQTLSGGNQQKVILGRELLLDCPVILLDQPTRGLDVGSIEYVHDQILAMRAAGRALLMVSASLEELFLLADRIVVLHRGSLVADVPVEQTTVEQVGRWMLEGVQGDG